MSALFAAAGILCFILLGYTFLEEREAEAKLAGLSAVRIEMDAERKEREKENQLLSELKSLEEMISGGNKIGGAVGVHAAGDRSVRNKRRRRNGPYHRYGGFPGDGHAVSKGTGKGLGR